MAESCAVQSNLDLYGLGIRLGFYLSWTTSQIAYLFDLQDSVNQIYESTLILQVALVIAIAAISIIGEASVHAAEVVILLYLFYGNLSCIQQRRAGSDEKADVDSTERKNEVTGWQRIMESAALFSIAVYLPWFWIYGITSSAFLGHEHECRPHLFLFANISSNQFSSVRTFFATISTAYAAICTLRIYSRLQPLISHLKEHGLRDGLRGLLTVKYSKMEGEFWENFERKAERKVNAVLYRRDTLTEHPDTASQRSKCSSYTSSEAFSQSEAETVSREGSTPSRWSSRISRRTSSTPSDQSEKQSTSTEKGNRSRLTHHIVNILGRTIHFTIMAFLVTGIELMLKWNKISAVYDFKSVGQLLPFVIGLFGVLKVLADFWDKYKDKYSSKQATKLDCEAFAADSYDRIGIASRSTPPSTQSSSRLSDLSGESSESLQTVASAALHSLKSEQSTERSSPDSSTITLALFETAQTSV